MELKRLLELAGISENSENGIKNKLKNILSLFQKVKTEYPPKLTGEALEKQQKLFAEIEDKLTTLMKDPSYSFNGGLMTLQKDKKE